MMNATTILCILLLSLYLLLAVFWIHSFWTMPTRMSVSLGYSLATPS